MVNDLLTAEDRGKQHLRANIKQWLTDGSVGFLAALRRHHSTTYADTYKVVTSTQQSMQKSIKADRKLLLRLLNAVTADQLVEMESINSLIHQSLEKLGEVPSEMSVKKCVTVHISHIIFWQ